MKGKIKKTGEIVDLTTSKNLSGETVLVKTNTALVFSLDEIELMPTSKMVSLDAVCEWIMSNSFLYMEIEYLPDSDSPQAYIDTDKMIKDIRKKFGE